MSIATAESSQTEQKGVGFGKPLTLILFDSNLNFDSDKTETLSLDLIRFQSDNVRTTLGPKGGVQDAFNPHPSTLRETGDNTGIFYTVIEIPRMINGKQIDFGEKIEFQYTQRGAGAKIVAKPGAFSQDMLEQLGSTSKVSMTAKSFRFGQPVEVTLNDPDLNQNSDLIDIHRVVDDPKSPFVDTVGSANGGILLEIKIKDIRYQRCTIDGIQYGGLAASGFSLVETGPSTGIFKGIFKIPTKICDKTGTELVTAIGSIKAVYHDFRDSAGQRNIQTR